MYLLGGEDKRSYRGWYANADVLYDNVIDSSDSLTLMNYVAMIITESELGPQGLIKKRQTFYCLPFLQIGSALKNSAAFLI